MSGVEEQGGPAFHRGEGQEVGPERGGECIFGVHKSAEEETV